MLTILLSINTTRLDRLEDISIACHDEVRNPATRSEDVCMQEDV